MWTLKHKSSVLLGIVVFKTHFDAEAIIDCRVIFNQNSWLGQSIFSPENGHCAYKKCFPLFCAHTITKYTKKDEQHDFK